MEEFFQLTSGNNTIDVNGLNNSATLYHKNKKMSFIFHYCESTDMRYYLGTGIESLRLDSKNDYHSVTNEGRFDFNSSLSKQFSHILNLLTNADYNLRLCKLETEIEIDKPSMCEKHIFANYEHYGGGYSLFATQTNLNYKKVKEYEAKLSYIRPIAVLLGIKNCNINFILDGHHKLEAYNNLRLEPICLVITKMSNINYNGLDDLAEISNNNSELINKYQDYFNTESNNYPQIDQSFRKLYQLNKYNKKYHIT